MKKLAKILYFVKGASPTAEDFANAEEIKGNVVFRNALAVGHGESVEKCDGVAGEVPPAYSHLPSAEDAVVIFKNKILGKTKGDEAPPKVAYSVEVAKKAETKKPAWGAK